MVPSGRTGGDDAGRSAGGVEEGTVSVGGVPGPAPSEASGLIVAVSWTSSREERR